MIKILRLSILLLILLSTSNAQQIIDLYGDILGDKIMENEYYREQINTKLKLNSIIDPQLIYYIIENTNYRVNLGIRDTEKNFAKQLSKKSNTSRQKINQWNALQRLNLEKISSNTAQLNIIESYLDQLVFKTTADTTIIKNDGPETDLNKMNFYLYRYFSGNKSNTYSSTTDYSTKVKAGLAKLVTFFDEKYNSNKNFTETEKKHIIEKALRYPYLFAGTYLESISETTDFQLIDFLKKYTRDEIVTKNVLGLQILSSLTLLNTASGNLYYKRSFIEIDEKVTVSVQSGFHIAVSYSIPIKDNVGAFSKIKFDAGIPVANLIKPEAHFTELKDAFIYDPQTNEIFAGSYKVKQGNHKYDGYFFRIYSPVYYYNNRFYMEAGLGYFYSKIKLNYEIQYDTREDLDYPDKEVFSFSEEKSTPGFVFNVNYQLFDELLFKFDTFIPMEFIICLEYQLNL